MGLRCFFSRPTKKFSFQIGEKIERRKWDNLIDKNTHAQPPFFFGAVLGMLPPFFLFLFCLLSFPILSGHCLLLLLPFFFFLGFPRRCLLLLLLLLLFLFLCLTRHDFFFFFLDMILFFNEFGDFIFCHLFVLISHHFLTRVYE